MQPRAHVFDNLCTHIFFSYSAFCRNTIGRVKNTSGFIGQRVLSILKDQSFYFEFIVHQNYFPMSFCLRGSSVSFRGGTPLFPAVIVVGDNAAIAVIFLQIAVQAVRVPTPEKAFGGQVTRSP